MEWTECWNDGMDKLLYVSYNIGGGGDLVSKSCLTLATPWTAARQAPLSSFPLSFSFILRSLD